MLDVIFLLLSSFAIGGALGMVLFHQPVHSALSLILCIIALSGLFALLSASFLFLVQIIVYAGAIITLLIFIIMFLNVKEANLPKEPHKNITLFLGSLGLIPLNILILRAFYKMPSSFLEKNDNFGDIKPLGMELFEHWLLPFELISILLLVALIGAVVFGKGRSMIAGSLFSYIVVAMLLLSIGLLGVISRKNIFVIYMSIELMLNAINLIFIALGRHHHSMSGHIMAMMVIAIAAAEAAVFLSLIVVLYHRKKSLDSDIFRSLSQKESL